MRVVGILYLFSALGFSLMGMLAPLAAQPSEGASGSEQFIVWMIVIDLIASIVSWHSDVDKFHPKTDSRGILDEQCSTAKMIPRVPSTS